MKLNFLIIYLKLLSFFNLFKLFIVLLNDYIYVILDVFNCFFLVFMFFKWLYICIFIFFIVIKICFLFLFCIVVDVIFLFCVSVVLKLFKVCSIEVNLDIWFLWLFFNDFFKLKYKEFSCFFIVLIFWLMFWSILFFFWVSFVIFFFVFWIVDVLRFLICFVFFLKFLEGFFKLFLVILFIESMVL